MADDLKISEMQELLGGDLHDDIQFEVIDLTEPAVEDQNKRVKLVTLEAAFGAEDKIFEDDSSVEVIDTGTGGEVIVTLDGSEQARFNPDFINFRVEEGEVGGIQEVLDLDGANSTIFIGRQTELHLRVGTGSDPTIRAMSGSDTWLYLHPDYQQLGSSAAGNAYLRTNPITPQIIGSVNGATELTLGINGLALKTGASVNEIETTLTDDDTHLPTSGAVFGALAAFSTDKIFEGDSSVEVVDTGATGYVEITIDGLQYGLFHHNQINVGDIPGGTYMGINPSGNNFQFYSNGENRLYLDTQSSYLRGSNDTYISLEDTGIGKIELTVDNSKPASFEAGRVALYQYLGSEGFDIAGFDFKSSTETLTIGKVNKLWAELGLFFDTEYFKVKSGSLELIDIQYGIGGTDFYLGNQAACYAKIFTDSVGGFQIYDTVAGNYWLDVYPDQQVLGDPTANALFVDQLTPKISGIVGSTTVLDLTTTLMQFGSTNDKITIDPGNYQRFYGSSGTPWLEYDIMGDIANLKSDGGLAIGRIGVYQGKLTLYGNSTLNEEGGQIAVHTADDWDSTIPFYWFRAWEEDLEIGPATNPDALKYDADVNRWIMSATGGWHLDVGGAGQAKIIGNNANLYVGEKDLGWASAVYITGGAAGAPSGGAGGTVILYANTSYQTFLDRYVITCSQDDLEIGPNINQQAIKIIGQASPLLQLQANGGVEVGYGSANVKLKSRNDGLEFKGDQTGAAAIGNAATSVAVTFGTAKADANYQVLVTLENTVDGSPLFLIPLVTAKATTGFTVTL